MDAPTTLAQRLTRGFLTLVTLVVLYVLSIGPLWGLFPWLFVGKGHMGKPEWGPLRKYYLPLIRTVRWAGLTRPVDDYIDWWRIVAWHLGLPPEGE